MIKKHFELLAITNDDKVSSVTVNFKIAGLSENNLC